MKYSRRTEAIISIVFWIIALSLLFHFTSKADDVFIRGGPSIKQGTVDGTSKYLGLRKEYKKTPLNTALEAGGWTDSSGSDNRPSLALKTQLGVSPGASRGIFGKAYLGPSLISSPDATLGGHFQFATDIGFGVRDENSSVLVGYSHFSSAGLEKPNKGRDFIILEMGIKW